MDIDIDIDIDVDVDVDIVSIDIDVEAHLRLGGLKLSPLADGAAVHRPLPLRRLHGHCTHRRDLLQRDQLLAWI